MNIEEYNKIKDFDYETYFDYLQEKYGVPAKDYFLNENCKSKNAISRAKEGLIVHHKYENRKANLEDAEVAVTYDFYAQRAENLCYANMIEHLFLHYLIFKYYFSNTENDDVTNKLIDYIKKLYDPTTNLNRWDKCYLSNIADCSDVFNAIVDNYMEQYNTLKPDDTDNTDNVVEDDEILNTVDSTEPPSDTEQLDNEAVSTDENVHDEAYWFNLWKSVENENLGHQICFHANALHILNKNSLTYEKDRERLLKEIEEIYKKFS